MHDRSAWLRASSLVAVVTLAGCAPPAGDPAGSLFPDERTERPPISQAAAPRIEGDESMAALTAEVRQLRVAVQELARSQAEAQALSIYMSAQQGRLSQASQQLDAARRELDSVSARSQDAEARLTAYSNELPGTTDPERRAVLEDAIRSTQAERPELDREVQQARARESDASRRLSVEEDRWGDLLARLDELTN